MFPLGQISRGATTPSELLWHLCSRAPPAPIEMPWWAMHRQRADSRARRRPAVEPRAHTVCPPIHLSGYDLEQSFFFLFFFFLRNSLFDSRPRPGTRVSRRTRRIQLSSRPTPSCCRIRSGLTCRQRCSPTTSPSTTRSPTPTGLR